MEISNVRTEMSREVFAALPAQQADQAAKAKAQTRPVENSANAARGALDDKRLRQEEERAKKRLSDAEMQEVVNEVQDRLEMMGGTNLQFAMDKVAEDIVVKVTDKQSGELIRQIPSEEVVMLRKKLEELTGLLFEGKA